MKILKFLLAFILILFLLNYCSNVTNELDVNELFILNKNDSFVDNNNKTTYSKSIYYTVNHFKNNEKCNAIIDSIVCNSFRWDTSRSNVVRYTFLNYNERTNNNFIRAHYNEFYLNNIPKSILLNYEFKLEKGNWIHKYSYKHILNLDGMFNFKDFHCK